MLWCHPRIPGLWNVWDPWAHRFQTFLTALKNSGMTQYILWQSQKNYQLKLLLFSQNL